MNVSNFRAKEVQKGGTFTAGVEMRRGVFWTVENKVCVLLCPEQIMLV